MRLRRSDLTKPGYGRRRSGKGFRCLDTDGTTTLRDEDAVTRIKELVIPPAWTDVWISTDPRGYIQDAAGRKQYLYHPAWRTARDEEKFDHAPETAERLPEMRSRLCTDLSGRGLTRERLGNTPWTPEWWRSSSRPDRAAGRAGRAPSAGAP